MLFPFCIAWLLFNILFAYLCKGNKKIIWRGGGVEDFVVFPLLSFKKRWTISVDRKTPVTVLDFGC